MKVALWSLGLVAMLMATSMSAGSAQTKAAVQPSDKTLDQRIEQQMKADASLKKYDIDVSVSDGIAKLTGTVATDAERTRAARHAKISGITRVDNQIVVDASAATTGTAGMLEGKAKQAVETTKHAAGTAVDKTKEGLSKTGEVITDGWITSRVHARFLGEDLLKESGINVDTDNHVVTLKGTVMSAAGRARAVEIAKTTEGVHQVIDRLTIGPKPKS